MAASLQVRASCQVDEFKKDWLSWGEALGDVLGLESSGKSSGCAPATSMLDGTCGRNEGGSGAAPAQATLEGEEPGPPGLLGSLGLHRPSEEGHAGPARRGRQRSKCPNGSHGRHVPWPGACPDAP